jgi:hypothetical protein
MVWTASACFTLHMYSLLAHTGGTVFNLVRITITCWLSTKEKCTIALSPAALVAKPGHEVSCCKLLADGCMPSMHQASSSQRAAAPVKVFSVASFWQHPAAAAVQHIMAMQSSPRTTAAVATFKGHWNVSHKTHISGARESPHQQPLQVSPTVTFEL